MHDMSIKIESTTQHDSMITDFQGASRFESQSYQVKDVWLGSFTFCTSIHFLYIVPGTMIFIGRASIRDIFVEILILRVSRVKKSTVYSGCPLHGERENGCRWYKQLPKAHLGFIRISLHNYPCTWIALCALIRWNHLVNAKEVLDNLWHGWSTALSSETVVVLAVIKVASCS